MPPPLENRERIPRHLSHHQVDPTPRNEHRAESLTNRLTMNERNQNVNTVQLNRQNVPFSFPVHQQQHSSITAGYSKPK